ncbi:MAG: DUF502 domain-containing protein [Luteitalea sp.]|nr:DUF502 domain-containing protein [Luteitalea sp.]
MTSLLLWLRRRFIAGFFVMVPLVVSVAALVWIFQFVDGLLAPVYEQWIGQQVPGLGLVTTVVLVLLVGAAAMNVFGNRLLQRVDTYLLRVPVFRTVYAPVKQLVAAFNPDNEFGFKRMALVEDPHRGLALGFLTREFTVDRGSGPEALVAVYVPTNHLYLGDVLIYPRERVRFPQMSVEEGIRVFLTGGMALPDRLATTTAETAEPSTFRSMERPGRAR